MSEICKDSAYFSQGTRTGTIEILIEDLSATVCVELAAVLDPSTGAWSYKRAIAIETRVTVFGSEVVAGVSKHVNGEILLSENVVESLDSAVVAEREYNQERWSEDEMR